MFSSETISPTTATENARQRKQVSREKEREEASKLRPSEKFRPSFKESMLQFDEETSALKHNHCHFCKSTSINLKMHRYKKEGKDICARCFRSRPWDYDYQKTLPVWYLDKVPQFHVPIELSCLNEGEKLLIQQASCYVPLVYLKHGNVGNDGHVCSFPVDIGAICLILPRLPADCQFVRIVKKYIAKDTKELCSTNFTVRRQAVLTALNWLRRYNKAYEHITIAESNLDWMDGKQEAELPCNMEEDNLDGDNGAGKLRVFRCLYAN
jgi:hypothetical protein